MTRRGKHILLLSAWLAAYFLFGFGVWSFQAGHLFVLLFLAASVLVYMLYGLSARCPKCSMPVLVRRIRLFGMELYLWSILTPERCRNCGAII